MLKLFSHKKNYFAELLFHEKTPAPLGHSPRPPSFLIKKNGPTQFYPSLLSKFASYFIATVAYSTSQKFSNTILENVTTLVRDR